MHHSPTVHEFVCRVLGAEAGTVVLDLNACTYLDSTFLGCLLDLHKHFGITRPPRFTVAATPAEARKLFGATRLDAVLNIAAICPLINGTWHVLATQAADAREVARHVMECHRVLSEVEGPNQAVFARIADQMERELRKC
jgi:anti-anti-sigma factor